jgi:DNA-directed RNA polymerase subunit RPC12/RpoP
MSSKIKAFLFTILLLFSSTQSTQAQEDTPLTIRLSRNFGYSSGTGDIQGTFTLRADGPDNLTRVVFYIDDSVMGEVLTPPFELRFQTDDFPLGVHTIRAVGYTSEGVELHSNEQIREFVTAEEGWQFVGKIVLPLIGVIALAVLISIAIPYLTGRGGKNQVPLGAQRNYGMFGGTICPKCGRPFGMHAWGLNLAVGKLDRCPHCGKWSMVRRVPQSALREAEAAELNMADQPAELEGGSNDRLRKELEESRYQDID